jgi:hypothetical protein
MSHLALSPRANGQLLSEQPYLMRPDMARAHEPVSDLYTVFERLMDAQRHFGEPVSRQRPSTAERFRMLARRWREETATLSSMSEMAMHPAYQQIIGLGPGVLSVMLLDLKETSDHWFWALKAITGVDPVPPELRGRVREMVSCWLHWGRDEGLID